MEQIISSQLPVGTFVVWAIMSFIRGQIPITIVLPDGSIWSTQMEDFTVSVQSWPPRRNTEKNTTVESIIAKISDSARGPGRPGTGNNDGGSGVGIISKRRT